MVKSRVTGNNSPSAFCFGDSTLSWLVSRSFDLTEPATPGCVEDTGDAECAGALVNSLTGPVEVYRRRQQEVTFQTVNGRPPLGCAEPQRRASSRVSRQRESRMEENLDVRVMSHSSVDEARRVLVRRGVGAQQGKGAARSASVDLSRAAMKMVASVKTSAPSRPCKFRRPANQCAVRRRKAPRSQIIFFRYTSRASSPELESTAPPRDAGARGSVSGSNWVE